MFNVNPRKVATQLDLVYLTSEHAKIMTDQALTSSIEWMKSVSGLIVGGVISELCGIDYRDGPITVED